MKTTTLIAITAMFGTCTLAMAKDKNKRHPHEVPAEVLEKWDTDGDGELSEEERKAMRKAHHQKMLDKFDTDGDGKLSEEERKAMQEAMEARRQELLEKYDENDNGRLDPEEIKEAREDGEEIPPHRGPHGKDHKHKKCDCDEKKPNGDKNVE